MIGGIVAVAITGDELYTFVWVSGLGLAVIVLCTMPILLRRRVTAGAAARPVRPAANRVLLWGVPVAVLLAGGAAAVLPAAAVVASGATDDMITGSHQQLAMDAIAHAAGTTRLIDVDFYPGYVIAQVPRHAHPGDVDTGSTAPGGSVTTVRNRSRRAARARTTDPRSTSRGSRGTGERA